MDLRGSGAHLTLFNVITTSKEWKRGSGVANFTESPNALTEGEENIKNGE